VTRAILEWTDSSGAAQALEIDATPTRSWEDVAEITEHPVETGAAVSDHVRPQNGTVTLDCLVSDTPLFTPRSFVGGAAPVTAPVQLPSGAAVTVQRWSAPVERTRLVDAALLDVVSNGLLVTLSTDLRRIDSLAVRRYAPEESADNGRALRFTLELKRVRIVSTRRAPVPAVRRAQVQLERGAQPPDDRSALARGIDGGRPADAARTRTRALLRALGGGA